MSTINVNQRGEVKEGLKAVRGVIIAVAVVLAAVVLFNLSTFTVGESEQAAVYRFGTATMVVLDPEITYTEQYPDLMSTVGKAPSVKVVYGKGLYFKMPFVDTVKKYNSWLYTYISAKEKVNTSDKNQYEVMMYAQWRIANPVVFNATQQTESRANQLLDNTIYPILVQTINTTQASDFISNKDLFNERLKGALKEMNNALRNNGMEVLDVQVNRTLLPSTNLQSTYDRMIANRQKVAQQLRSEGQETYQKAVSEADLEASKLESEAIAQAKTIEGQADAQALEIYAQGYSKDTEFYGYWRSLQALKNALTHDATIVLDRNHPLWKDLLGMINAGSVDAN